MVQKIFALPPASIEYKNFNFLITDRPTNRTIKSYIRELKKHKVMTVVRVCEANYNTEDLEKEGIHVYDLVYRDGSFPPEEVVDEWISLLKQQIADDQDTSVAIHCVAGLGRAPVLVAIALLEMGMKYEDAVEMIREKKRGAINTKQLDYLQKYRPKYRLRNKDSNSCCIS